ncbi:hypothetical protein LENED_002730 [Lentinula edodes]|uniref:BRCT domain-containing protein n=1 Tax=Lentinula edodes TaxID=5353 RepID=A0A1Q3E1P8_LENED|nr:hypothetical protein LENED_002730 [Lentinula edodes]
MLDCNETGESQTSQELAKLLANENPGTLAEESQVSEELSTKYEPSDPAQSEHYSPRQQYSLLDLGQGSPMSQTQHFSDDVEEGTHGSQKENHHSSTELESSKLEPNDPCSSNENAFTWSKNSPNAHPDPDEQSESLQRLSVSLERRDEPSVEAAGNVPSPPSQLPGERPESEMICSDFGASSPERLDGIREALSNHHATPISQIVDSQSQNSDKASQFSEIGSQDDEPQAQVVPEYDMDVLRRMENELYPDSQSQATQSTQPAASSDDNVINDKDWANFTGIQVPPHRRHRYLASAKEGAAIAAVRNDTFYDGYDSSAPPLDDGFMRQFPAGMPDPGDSDQETQPATQPAESSQQEGEWVPPVQFPAGHGSTSQEEGAATQIVEAQDVATQILDESLVNSDEVKPGSVGYSVIPAPKPPVRTTFTRAKSPISALEIVPDSEPPVPSPVKSTKRSSSVHAVTSPRQVFDTRAINQPVGTHPQPMEVDEVDEVEIPLAAVVKSGIKKVDNVKGCPSAAHMPPPPPKRSTKAEDKRQDNQNQEMTATVTQIRTSSKRKATPVTETVKDESSKKKGRVTKAKTTMPPARRSTRPTRNRRSLVESDSDGDIDDEIVLIKEEDDVVTVSGDGVDMTPSPSAAGESHRKRKRSVAISVPRKALKKEHMQTPANHPRRHSTASVNGKNTIQVASLRVLVLYTDGYWYPGTVREFQTPDSYKILYDDNSAGWAKTGSMRQLELRVGDEVMDSKTKKSGTVSEVKEDMIVVSGSGITFDLTYRYLRIPCDKVEAQWSDRELTIGVLAGIHDTSRQSALPEGADSFLRGCGIIITSNPNALQWNKEKNEILAAMIENGATLIEDWSDALQTSGTYIYDKGKGKKGKGKDTGNRNPKSWKITKEQARWFEDPDEGSIRRVFVLADAVCQKPKYLIALALGVPCLSTNWMTDSLQNRDAKEWSSYLLPKGIDNYTSQNVRLSQSVNLDWGMMPEHLTNIMDNPYAQKLFSGSSVLCVGDDYIPEQHEERMSANNYDDHGLGALRIVTNRSKITSGVPLIILAMGASQVTAVANLQDASKDEHFDYVLFKDPKWNSKFPAPKEGTIYASWSWAKQSLIRGQMLPLPENN